MAQKITIPQQNQPFRRQSSLGGNVSFRNLGGTDDSNYVVMAIVTKVYYKQGRVDFKLTNSTNHVVTESGDGIGSAPIPVDFYGYQRNGKIFGHYRPIQVGDLIAVAYLWGHKQAPIVLGVYPKNSSSYEFVAPQDALSSGDDKDEATYDYALGDQKIFPDGSLEYHSGNGKYFKTLRGKSFMLLDDSPLYDHLWLGYNDIGAFKNNDQEAIHPLQEEAGDWLLVHEDNNEGSNSTDHRTRFYVKKDGTFQVVLSKSSSLDNLVILEGSKSEGFALQQLYNVPQKGWISENDPHKEPDLKNAQQYVKFNIGGSDRSATIEAATKDDSVEQATKLEIKDDGIYVNDKPLISSNPKYAGKTIIDDTINNSDGLNGATKKAQDAAEQAAEQAKQAGEIAKQAGLSAEAAGDSAKKMGDDIKHRIVYYASVFPQGDHYVPGKYLAINTDTYIADGTIKNAAIENGAIDHAKIADEAVGSSQIEDLAVTRGKLAYMAVGSAQIEDLAVTDEKVGKLTFDHMIGATLDAGKINVINLTAKNIKAGTITADKLNIKGLSDITSNAGTINQGTIQAGDDPNSGVVINNLDADNPNKYTPAKKAFLLSEVQKLDSAADAAIDYGKNTGVDYSGVEKAQKAMHKGLDGLPGLDSLLANLAETTEFDYNRVINLEQNLQDAINTFHNSSNSDIIKKIGTTADGKNSVYQGYEQPANPHINDIWFQENSDGNYQIEVYDGGQWINPGLADIKAVKNSLSGLPKSYYQTEEPVGPTVHDGDTWYKLTKGSDGNYTYTPYKFENNQWVQLLDNNDVTNQTAIHNLNTSLSKLPQSYYSSTQPAGTDYKDGDIWYKISTNTTNNNVVYTPFKWNPNTNTWDPMLDASSSRNYVGSAPASPLEGDFWMDNTTLKQYQNGQWVVVPTQGAQGIPGKPGADGKTYYTWIKYATDSKGSNMGDSPTGMSYIGIAYNKESETESNTATDYKWTKIKGEQGIQGPAGADGKTSYLHVAYAQNPKDPNGNTGFTIEPDTSVSYKYIGTYTDYTSTSSTNPSSYTWAPMFDSTKKRNFTTQPTPPYDVGDTWTQSGATYFCTKAKDSSGAFDVNDWTMQQLTIRALSPSVTNNLYNDNLLINTSNSSTNGQTTIYDPSEIGQSGSQGETGPSGSTSSQGLPGPAGQSVWFYQYDRGANRPGSWWSDLRPTPTTVNPPKVGDTIIDSVGNIYQITNVVVGTTEQGGGTFDYGPLLTSIKGATGPQGPSGTNGQTPQIASNGHWQIGNNVTNYSVGMLDADDSTTLIDLSTNKALYNPSEKVIFHATSVSGHGHLDVHYYHLNNLVAEKQIYYGTSEISWSWFLPADDNVGYSVVIDNYVGSNVSYNNKIAINVCSNVYQFPIMGFLSNYTIDSPDDRKQVLDYMKRLHINLVQMYDWFDLHSLPLPVATNGDSTQVSNTWTDIGNRLTRKKVIEDYCNLAKEYAMKPLAYMAMNGSDTNQLVHGLTADMFLYNDNSKSLDSVYKTLDNSNGWGKYSLYSTNWMNESWQNYIVNQMGIVRDNMPFDGWHIDMFGDPGNKYENNGNSITSATLAGGIHYFLNKANALGWDTGVNSVGEYGLDDIRNSTVPKYLYTEVWDNRKTYDDLFNLVKFLTESRDSSNVKKGVIIAAYMDYNYAKSNQGKNFNDDGIILTDLVIMASGGMHLEVGEHLLDNEYFPNNNLNMSDSLKNTYLPEMYDFFTAFKEIIGQGYQVDGLATIDGGSVDSLVAGEVCGISRGNDKGYLGLSIINMQTNGDQWRDTDANRTITKPVGNVKVTLNKGVTNHDWYLFNLGNLTPQKLNVGADGAINISGLDYYSFILGVPK